MKFKTKLQIVQPDYQPTTFEFIEIGYRLTDGTIDKTTTYRFKMRDLKTILRIDHLNLPVEILSVSQFGQKYILAQDIAAFSTQVTIYSKKFIRNLIVSLLIIICALAWLLLS